MKSKEKKKEPSVKGKRAKDEKRGEAGMSKERKTDGTKLKSVIVKPSKKVPLKPPPWPAFYPASYED